MKISTNEYLQAIAEGCKLLKNKEFDLIIGISRGGLIPAVYISHFLDVPLTTIECAGYDANNEQNKEYKLILGNIRNRVKDKRCLLVDDIGDTGGTLELSTEQLHKFAPASVDCLALFVKEHLEARPKFFVKEVPNEWVDFPYEIGDFAMEGQMFQKCIQDTVIFDKKFGTDVTNKPTIVNLMYNSLGLAGEAGEVANITKKIVRDGVTTKKLNRIAEELVDTVIYLCKIILVLNLNFERAWNKKRRKLYKRWYQNKSIAEGIRSRVNINDKLSLRKEGKNGNNN